MKAKQLHIILVKLTIAFFLLQPCFSQNWGGDDNIVPQAKWMININGGLTSYFGDLSLKSPEVWSKLEQESGPAISIILTRNIFHDAIGISGQVLAGKLKGKEGNISFSTQLIEMNIQARVDFLNLFLPKQCHAFGIVAYTGVGKFLFSVENVVAGEGSIETLEYDARVPEFVYFFGTGIYYNFNPNFGITADFAIRQSKNDRLDDYIMNNNYDYYSYASIGITYYLKSAKIKPLKNKARLANSNFLFRSPSIPAQR